MSQSAASGVIFLEFGNVSEQVCCKQEKKTRLRALFNFQLNQAKSLPKKKLIMIAKKVHIILKKFKKRFFGTTKKDSRTCDKHV